MTGCDGDILLRNMLVAGMQQMRLDTGSWQLLNRVTELGPGQRGLCDRGLHSIR